LWLYAILAAKKCYALRNRKLLLFILLFNFKCKLLILYLQILAALEIVRQGADVMPKSQLNEVLDAELGPGWSSKLISFDYEPIAAASIGQVFLCCFFIFQDGQAKLISFDYEPIIKLSYVQTSNLKFCMGVSEMYNKNYSLAFIFSRKFLESWSWLLQFFCL